MVDDPARPLFGEDQRPDQMIQCRPSVEQNFTGEDREKRIQVGHIEPSHQPLRVALGLDGLAYRVRPAYLEGSDPRCEVTEMFLCSRDLQAPRRFAHDLPLEADGEETEGRTDTGNPEGRDYSGSEARRCLS